MFDGSDLLYELIAPSVPCRFETLMIYGAVYILARLLDPVRLVVKPRLYVYAGCVNTTDLYKYIRDEYARLDLVAMLLVDVQFSIVVSSVRYSYIDISYCILSIILSIISFSQFLRCL